jgi:hypothetical protein
LHWKNEEKKQSLLDFYEILSCNPVELLNTIVTTGGSAGTRCAEVWTSYDICINDIRMIMDAQLLFSWFKEL